MNRRQFLGKTSLALATSASLAGCTGEAKAPPRESEVFNSIATSDGDIVVTFENEPVVQSMADVKKGKKKALADPGFLGALAPVGVASAGKGKGGKGASGRGRGGSAPPGRNGRKKWHGGSYNSWHDDHDDDVDEYRANVSRAAIGFIASDAEYADDPPGAGAIEWNETWRNPSGKKRYDASRPGWYRVGAKLSAPGGGHDFGWEAVDFELVDSGDGYAVRNEWKISPRL